MSDTIQVKKDTFYQISIAVLGILLIVSLFTGGFGINSTGAVVQNANANAGNTGNTAAAASGDTSVIVNNPNLFPQLGPSNAKSTVIELADFQCPYCALASGLPSWVSQYQSQYGSLIGAAGNAEQAAEQGKIRFIFVPLSFLDSQTNSSSKESTWAAEAGFCVLKQSNSLFWKMHDAIYKASTGPSEDTGKYTKANLEILAKGISGLDTTKFNSCLESDATLSQVQQVMSTVQQAGFQISTPQFWVNGKQVSPSWSAIQSAAGI